MSSERLVYTTGKTYVGPDLSLPDEVRDALSEGAIKIYSKLWNLMRRKDKTDIWISDSALSISARVDFDLLESAKNELIDAGLFTFKEGKWPKEDPIKICHRYRFAAEQD